MKKLLALFAVSAVAIFALLISINHPTPACAASWTYEAPALELPSAADGMAAEAPRFEYTFTTDASCTKIRIPAGNGEAMTFNVDGPNAYLTK